MSYTGPGINRSVFNQCFTNTRGRVKYRLGAKPQLYSDSSTFDHSDCSGFTDWDLSRTVSDFSSLGYPEGSENEHTWCAAHLSPWSWTMAYADRTNRIFQCFIPQGPDPNEVSRHTYFMQNGATIECDGSNGVTSQDAALYRTRTTGIFLWPSFLP